MGEVYRARDMKLKRDVALKIAISLLDALLGVDGGTYLPLIEIEPMWDSLRDHPDYAAMVARHR